MRSGRSGIPGQSPLQALPQPSHLQEKAKKNFFSFFDTMAREMFVPRKGIKPKFPALEGGFFTIGPPGKSKDLFLMEDSTDSSKGQYKNNHLNEGQKIKILYSIYY